MELDVLLLLLWIVGGGRKARPSDMARKLNTTPQTVWRHLDTLIARGLVVKESRGVYTVNHESSLFFNVFNCAEKY